MTTLRPSWRSQAPCQWLGMEGRRRVKKRLSSPIKQTTGVRAALQWWVDIFKKKSMKNKNSKRILCSTSTWPATGKTMRWIHHYKVCRETYFPAFQVGIYIEKPFQMPIWQHVSKSLRRCLLSNLVAIYSFVYPFIQKYLVSECYLLGRVPIRGIQK